MEHNELKPESRSCDFCGKRTGAITCFRAAMILVGIKPKSGYAHERCFREARAALDLARK